MTEPRPVKPELATNTQPGDSDLRKATQLELWELGDPGALNDTPAGLDEDTLRAAKLLTEVFGDSRSTAGQQPEKIGRFQVHSMLGFGRFGVVWRAFDPASQREVAIKVIHQSHMFDLNHRRRFLRECALAARLDHASIVPVYEAGLSEGMPYLVMPVCEGQTLDRWASDLTKPTPPRIAARIAQQIAIAAEHGHSYGILHRDLKPGNVMISPQSGTQENAAFSVRILDFGLAIPLDLTLRDTRGSLIAGTPVYMSPEQAECRTEAIGVGSDIFSIGAILYELLTGAPPFDAPTLPAVIERLQNETPRAVQHSRSDVPPDLDAICLKCLAHDPHHRYQSARELADDLARYLNDQPVTVRPLGRFHLLLTWCSRRRGQQNLALMTIVINLILMLWSIASIPVAIAQIPPGAVGIASLLPILGPLFAFIVPLHLILIWLSFQIRRLRRVHRNSLIALFLSMTTFLYAICVLSDLLPAAPSPAYARNSFARNVAFTLVATGFGLMSAIHLLMISPRLLIKKNNS